MKEQTQQPGATGHLREPAGPGSGLRADRMDDVEAVTGAVLTASRLLVAISARSLASVEDRVTLPQFRLLVVLSTHGAAKLVLLAERLAVSPSTAMRMVDRLIAVGLVDRRTNPGNRRETELRLTPEGARIVDEVMTKRRGEISTIVERLAPEQRAALIAALNAFSEAGGEPDAPSGPVELHPLGWTSGS